MMELNYVSQEELVEMHEASVAMLENTGIKCCSAKFLKVAEDVGLKVVYEDDGKTRGRIYYTKEQIEKAIETAPKKFSIYGLDNKYEIKWGERLAYNHTCVGTPFIADIETGKRRNTTLTDLEDYIRIADALPDTDIISCLTAQGIPEHAAGAIQTAAQVKNTSKPLRICIHTAEETQDVVNVLAAAVGSKEELMKKPIAYLEVSPISPMDYADGPAEATLAIIESGLPLGIIPCPMMGATGPMTLIGSVVMHNAEILAGVVVAQLVKPGCPVIMSPRVTFMDMKTAMGLWAAPEMGLAAAASAQMIRYYGLPSTVTGFSCASKVPDAQAGFESLLNTLMPALVGVDVVGASGSLDNVLVASFEKLVIDNEVSSLVKRAIRGETVNEDTCAVKVVDDVVNGEGNFLGHIHTLQHLRSELWKPFMTDRDIYENWLGERLDFTQRANRYAKDILANHKPSHLSAEKLAAVEAAVQAAIDRV